MNKKQKKLLLKKLDFMELVFTNASKDHNANKNQRKQALKELEETKMLKEVVRELELK